MYLRVSCTKWRFFTSNIHRKPRKSKPTIHTEKMKHKIHIASFVLGLINCSISAYGSPAIERPFYRLALQNPLQNPYHVGATEAPKIPPETVNQLCQKSIIGLEATILKQFHKLEIANTYAEANSTQLKTITGKLFTDFSQMRRSLQRQGVAIDQLTLANKNCENANSIFQRQRLTLERLTGILERVVADHARNQEMQADAPHPEPPLAPTPTEIPVKVMKAAFEMPQLSGLRDTSASLPWTYILIFWGKSFAVLIPTYILTFLIKRQIYNYIYKL